MYYGQDFISPELRDFLNNTPGLENIEHIDAIVRDDLTSEFVGAFCDHGGGKDLYTLCDPTMSKWRYYNSSQLIDANCDDETKKIWKYLHIGRSLNNQPFSNLNDDYKIGFWTHEEQQYLLNSVLRHFGSEKNIRQKYWTDQEKEFYEKVAKESSKSKYVLIAGFNPETEGIELVLELLRETINYRTEIVIGIE